MEFIIRDYQAETDWTAICRVHDRSRPDELAGSFDPRAFIPLAKDPEGEYIAVCDMFVAVHQGEVIGFAGIDDPYFAWLYVDPAYYRRGVGLALLRHCMDRLSDDAWTLACGNNTAAIELYEREGFAVEKRYTGTNAGFEGPSVRMALYPEQEGWKRPKKSEASSGESDQDAPTPGKPPTPNGAS